MGASENVELMLEIFRSIERRDAQRMLDLCNADVEFHWPPSLPYGGAGGDRFDGPLLGLYQVRDGKLARAQMFYFDTAAVVIFLSSARGAAMT